MKVLLKYFASLSNSKSCLSPDYTIDIPLIISDVKYVIAFRPDFYSIARPENNTKKAVIHALRC